MAQTTNLQLTLLEVGQKEKEVTINTNMAVIDNIPRYLGDSAAAPSDLSRVPLGSTYFNTTTSKLQVLRNKTGPVWSNAS